MEQAELILTLTRPLDELGIRYMATGAIAGTFYGIPRFTHDLDLVLELPLTMAGDLEQAYPAEQFYRPPAEIIRIEAHRRLRGHFNIIHHATGFKADVYLRGSDPLHAWGLDHRRHIEIDSTHGIWLAPPEYVILRKLEYFKEGKSEKHRDDIRGILEVSGDLIDYETIAKWAQSIQVTPQWTAISGRSQA